MIYFKSTQYKIHDWKEAWFAVHRRTNKWDGKCLKRAFPSGKLAACQAANLPLPPVPNLRLRKPLTNGSVPP